MSAVLATIADPHHVRSVWFGFAVMGSIMFTMIGIPAIAIIVAQHRAAAAVPCRPVMSTPTVPAAVTIRRVVR